MIQTKWYWKNWDNNKWSSVSCYQEESKLNVCPSTFSLISLTIPFFYNKVDSKVFLVIATAVVDKYDMLI